ncbi:hypothetical protein BDF21DRAFT_462068 [Thamnidium elegans]|uniref:Uncharacterized protein n=1 Tax=Thamnidium elegans TaxID=101142 RepID=A0A8H7W418_9FUNG|nr:hypothetical protein INT48_009713 [Thamnidium elegans]KAI8083901.1 hypothetical protein BDF21DRAFT_462068 [Thamnidium elegans]
MSLLFTPLRHGVNKTIPLFQKSYTTTTTRPALTGYRKYVQQFKSKPGSYMTSFAILHELTAVAPFPFIYLALDNSSLKMPFPENIVSEGNKFINKARVYYKYPPLESDNRVMVNLVTTYCIVKALLPLRIAASAAMTPFMAERVIGPTVAFIHKAIKPKTK